MTQRIYISDLHLEDPEDARARRFAELLAVEGQWADEIYILGDLVEMWIGDDDDSELAVWLQQQLRDCPAEVFVMHGNRDFLFGDAFAKATGAKLLPDPSITADGLLLTHGDSLCTDDKEYQAMRQLLRSDAWQQDILSKSLLERKALGQGLRQQSREANANKATNIMDVNAEALLTALEEASASVVIHGHTHRPGVHADSQSSRRYVLGAWERCGWLLRQKDSVLQLECFSLAHRYET